MTREVVPERLPRFPRFAVCPQCGNGGGEDPTVCSYVDVDMPENSPRFIICGYCNYDGPAPDNPLYIGVQKACEVCGVPATWRTGTTELDTGTRYLCATHRDKWFNWVVGHQDLMDGLWKGNRLLHQRWQEVFDLFLEEAKNGQE